MSPFQSMNLTLNRSHARKHARTHTHTHTQNTYRKSHRMITVIELKTNGKSITKMNQCIISALHASGSHCIHMSQSVTNIYVIFYVIFNLITLVFNPAFLYNGCNLFLIFTPVFLVQACCFVVSRTVNVGIM
jgi:hypothetical protein